MSQDNSRNTESPADDETDDGGLVPGFDADNIYHKIRKNEENDLDYMDLLTCGI